MKPALTIGEPPICGLRAEYFIAPRPMAVPFGITMDELARFGAITSYSTLRPGAPEGVWVMRIFAHHHKRFELLNLASFHHN